jgi:hypothetical protein
MAEEKTETNEPVLVGIIDEQLEPYETRSYIPDGVGFTLTSPNSLDPGHQHYKEIALTDGANVDIDVSLGSVFVLTAAGNRTINIPTNPANHYKIIIKHVASGAARTLSLTTGSPGAFRFGTTVGALAATDSGKTDYIGCIYNATDDRWDVVSVSKNF